MNFGLWHKSVHASSEQEKRIARAKKADVTPSIVDRDNKTAIFSGSGKNDYEVTLDTCTCGDFARRQLPCKHIYRLALELEGADVQQGVNKNKYKELPYDIFALPVETQEKLYNMCVGSIYHNQELFSEERNEFSELLLSKGFCVELTMTKEVLTAFQLIYIKNVIHKSVPYMNGLPKKNARKTTVMLWLETNFDSISDVINECFVFMRFTEHADRLKRTIHRRFTSRFKRVETEEPVFDALVSSEHLEPIFRQDAV